MKEKQSLFFGNPQFFCKNKKLNKYKRSKQTCHILHHVPYLNQILSFLRENAKFMFIRGRSKRGRAHTFFELHRSGAQRIFYVFQAGAQRGTHFFILPYSTFISNPKQQTLIQGIYSKTATKMTK